MYSRLFQMKKDCNEISEIVSILHVSYAEMKLFFGFNIGYNYFSKRTNVFVLYTTPGHFYEKLAGSQYRVLNICLYEKTNMCDFKTNKIYVLKPKYFIIQNNVKI